MKLPEDKRMQGLVCILSSPQGEREWHPSQLQGQPLVRILHGECVKVIGVAVEDTGVTNWGHHLAQELFSILSYLAQERPLWT